ncbi:DUF937 domain-containing protein [Aestuariivirga sp.]|uniref:DUF937 domain-containing protein n=1 Tax=Aestuariivirga sp. TaxID=2650926 RepID=UPI0039E6B9CD
MAVMDILENAQGGKLFAATAQSFGISEAQAKSALASICPAIARQLKIKSGNDPATFDALLDLLDDGADGSILDNASDLNGSAALSDGNAILDHVYGSRDAAIRTMRGLAKDIPETALVKLSAIGATAVVAALARTQATAQPQPLAGQPQRLSGGGGILGTLASALLKGVMQELQRKFAPRRRRRSYTDYFGARRTRRTTRRRAKQPSLEDIFGSILGTKPS